MTLLVVFPFASGLVSSVVQTECLASSSASSSQDNFIPDPNKHLKNMIMKNVWTQINMKCFDLFPSDLVDL